MKAFHFEVISILTSKAFIACLRRFVARKELLVPLVPSSKNYPHYHTNLRHNNSRPLCVLSNSPDDPCVMTSGDFLIGKALTAIPQLTVSDDLRPCNRWRLLIRNT
ncbi:hypothetical protein TNCV_4699061 [Trichonephila clavipes]|nr:hypothetical protein TNCV_4699061 [Trichonephila clavipes]